MRPKKSFSLLFLLFFLNMQAQTHFPGGVPNPEVWYSVDFDDLSNGVYPNRALDYIRITPCGMVNQALFNFNHSISTDQLCFTYNAPLERTSSRNVFFVGEVVDNSNPFSFVTTYWNGQEPPGTPTPYIRNRFDLTSQQAYVDNKQASFGNGQLANINFYNWNVYQTDKKIRSYGAEGETTFHIGREFDNQGIGGVQGSFFKGSFPEFISFPYELTANEKNRVESYLALKYGITLGSIMSYKNSKNIVFWNTVNNGIFKRRIFGIGRDDISGLNQLISESTHRKDYLVASVGSLAQTNKEKQEQVSISNNNFIVFGDNGEAEELGDSNDINIKKLKRVWLSQNTGNASRNIEMHLRLKLEGQLQQELIQDPTLKLWMLHDKNVNNLEVSGFNGQYIDYYEASLDGYDYAYFKNKKFDTDGGIYDQFTFGLGPQMIVQLRFYPVSCDAETIKTEVLITGGYPPYDVYVSSTNGFQTSFQTSDSITTFDTHPNGTYTVKVYDSQGLYAETTVDLYPPQITVDLGPDQVLSASQQQVLLDASQGVNDPGATYTWYRNYELLQHYDSTLLVTEPGEYTVVITASNNVCEVGDTINVSYNFIGIIDPVIACDSESASAHIVISGGVPPFTTTFSGLFVTISQVHNTEDYYVTDIPFGNYTVTITDSDGNLIQQNMMLADPLPGFELDLAQQVVQYCPFIPGQAIDMYDCGLVEVPVDVSVPYSYVTYEWFVDNTNMNINSPQVILYQDIQAFPGIDPSIPGITKIKVRVTNTQNGCVIEEVVAIRRFYGVKEAPNNYVSLSEEGTSETQDTPDTSETDPLAASILATVYPNPSQAGSDFNYEVTSSEVFEGTIEVFTQTGALLQQIPVSGKSNYNYTFSLNTPGTYFITTRTGETLLTNKIIIK